MLGRSWGSNSFVKISVYLIRFCTPKKKEFSDEAGEQIELVVNFRRGQPSIDAQYASPKRIQVYI